MSGRSRRRARMSLWLFKQTRHCHDTPPLGTDALYTAITGRSGSFRSGCINLDNERSLVVVRIHYRPTTSIPFVPLFALCILFQLLLSNGNALFSLCVTSVRLPVYRLLPIAIIHVTLSFFLITSLLLSSNWTYIFVQVFRCSHLASWPS